MNMSQEESNMDFNSLVSRFLSGEMHPDEMIGFQEELRRDPAKQALLEEYRKIWDSVDQVSKTTSYDLDTEWALIQAKLPGYTTDAEKPKAGKSRSLLYYSYRIAAILILGLVLSFSWFYVSRMAGMEKVVAKNEAVEVLLEDGTLLIVNRNSTLRYNKKSMAGVREVFLSGEAWFDVARDSTRPFVIDAGAALVEVLGTSFNVNAYKDNPVVEITVESGLVALSAKDDQEDLIVMKAGSGGTYHKGQKELTLVASSDPNNISWKTRELFFDGSSLREVSDLINRVYGVNMVITNPGLASCEITVTFKDQSLEAILKVLEMTLDLDISRSGDEIRLDGDGCNE
jgi:ferric-dicitrate binding protein FerR (iron transport regulator)